MKTSGNKLLAISPLKNSVFESFTSLGDSKKLKDKFGAAHSSCKMTSLKKVKDFHGDKIRMFKNRDQVPVLVQKETNFVTK
jgi:hypothetical protein